MNYKATKARVLIPSTNIKKLRLWTDYFFHWDPEMTPIECTEKRTAQPHEVPALQPNAPPVVPDGVDKATLQMENIKLSKHLAELQFELDQLRIERRLADQYEKKIGLDIGKKVRSAYARPCVSCDGCCDSHLRSQGSLKVAPGLGSPKKKESLLAKWRKNSSSSLGADIDPDAVCVALRAHARLTELFCCRSRRRLARRQVARRRTAAFQCQVRAR